MLAAVVLVGCAHSTDGEGAGSRYTVRAGDNLSVIAWRYGLDYRKLAAWNDLAPPYTIYPGQALRMSPPPGQRGSQHTDAEAASRAPVSPRSREQPAGPASREPAAEAAAPKQQRSTPSETHSQRQSKASGKDRRGSQTPSAQGPAGTGELHWRWPTDGRIVRRFSDRYAGKKGIAIGGDIGQPVRAASAGRVVYSGGGLVGYGRLIILKHNDKYISAYGHNRRLLVREGDRVRSGQKIAELGSSGADRAMLHFEIRVYGKPVDPLDHLPQR